MVDALGLHSVSGATQRGGRSHNEKAILSMIRKLGEVPASDIARNSNLSAQTVSVILRNLEAEGLVARGEPQRGRVGKPSIPMRLDPGGAWSVGLKIGRRTADLALMDLAGAIHEQRRLTYRYPEPEPVFAFLEAGLSGFADILSPSHRERLCGLGVAAPFQLWHWHDTLGVPGGALQAWQEIDFAKRVAGITDLPVHLMNDATAACRAEHHVGAGNFYTDYAHVFVGAFIGGGIVQNGKVVDGIQGNAGALGPLPSLARDGTPAQLIDTASLYLLESTLERDGVDPAGLWTMPQDWTPYSAQLEDWIGHAAFSIAHAALTLCAVIDFQAVVVDGAFPETVRAALVRRIRRDLSMLDARALIPPEIVEGRAGGNARVEGAALAPLTEQFFSAPNDTGPVLQP